MWQQKGHPAKSTLILQKSANPDVLLPDPGMGECTMLKGIFEESDLLAYREILKTMGEMI